MKKGWKIFGYITSSFSGILIGKISSAMSWEYLLWMGIVCLVWFVICKIVDNYTQIKDKYYYFLDRGLFWKKETKEVKGFFGRERVIEEIYNYHMESIDPRCVLLCGYGGSGKTTIAKYFSKTLNCKTTIEIYSHEQFKTIDIRQVKPNTIIFCDYALEGINDIVKLYHDIKESHKRRVTLILVERSECRQYCNKKEIIFDKCIDLNSSEYLLDESVLYNILQFNINYTYDEHSKCYKRNDLSMPENMGVHFVDLIINRFDREYKRPIFAVIIAEIYKRNPQIRFDEYKSISDLFNEYWGAITRKKRVENLFKEFESDPDFSRKEANLITVLSNEMRSKMRALIAVASLISIDIIVDVRNFEVQIYKANINENKSFEKLAKIIRSFLISGEISRFLEGENIRQLQYFLKEFGLKDFCTGNRISAPKYDLVANWLFVESINNTQEKKFIDNVFKIINNDNRLLHDALSFCIRAADEIFSPLLSYFSESVSYHQYTESDYIQDIQNCINHMINKAQNNENGYEACKKILFGLFVQLEKSNLDESSVWDYVELILQNNVDDRIWKDINSFWEEKEVNEKGMGGYGSKQL